MNWKIKSHIQNLVSMLPSTLSYNLYYFIQKQFGNYRFFSPEKRLIAGFKIWNYILANKINPIDKTFFEIGTGRVPVIPIAYYLLGARKTITFDLNPYLEDDLIKNFIRFILSNRHEVRCFFNFSIIESRLDNFNYLKPSSKFIRDELLEMCNIDYHSPADAANTALSEKCIDFHTSYTVLEHIPINIIKDILNEGNRIIKDNGLFINYIDYADHFSQTDKKISAINFLQYDDKTWHKYAGNKYMYMNRLRHDDFLQLFQEVGHEMIQFEKSEDIQAKELLESMAIKLDKRFETKSTEILSITKAWLVTKKASSS